MTHSSRYSLTRRAHSITYVALTETYRLYVLRRRQSLYRAYLDDRLPPIFGFKEMVQHRFASLRCWITGRYLNVTFEWREQTIYEFLLHHIVYRPLFGRIWWNGGLPADEAQRAAALPSEEVDVQLLKRKAGKPGSSPSSSETEEEWEKLEASRIGTSRDGGGSEQREANSLQTGKMTYTWLGQSTSLVQLGGVNILTDPVFAEQPLSSVLAPTRLRPPALSTDALLGLDILDVVCISHNHYDHLDIDFVRAVVAREANLSSEKRIKWILPLGVAGFMMRAGVGAAQIVEMDWWQEELVTLRSGKTIEAVCTPAQHWSGRTPFDTNRSLWCGFLLREPQSQRDGGHSFFHAGDTGYSRGERPSTSEIPHKADSCLTDLYTAIGRVYGPITLAAVPIGSWAPRHFMKYVHTDPQGAVAIHRDLQVQKSVAVHHATWIMSDERFDEPVKELYRVLDAQKATGPNAVGRDDFVVVPTGRTISV